MGRRLLCVTDDLLVHLCKGLQDGPPRYFRVASDPLPDDAKIEGIRTSPYHPNVVEVTLESAVWATDEPRTRVDPLLEVVQEKA